MADWIHMFVRRPFDSVDEAVAGEIVAEAVEALRPEMLRDGVWYADYVRLRMRAVKIG